MSHEVGIVGGGLAGGLSALLSARSGRSTILFEREKGAHHKVCGEFISAEGVACLRAAGIDFDALGATRIDVLVLNGPHLSFSCSLPWVARGISRYVLDEKLLALAREAGCEVHQGANVSNVVAGAQLKVETKNGFHFAVDRLLIATGKHDLRGIAERKGRDSDFVGYKMHLSLSPDLRGELASKIELFVFAGGYAGLSLVENEVANLCFLVEKSLAKKFGIKWDQIVAELSRLSPALAKYLVASQSLWDRPLTIAPIPYGFIREAPQSGSHRLQYLGDQLAVIPSLTGDGMSIALVSAVLAQHGRALSAAKLRSQIRNGYRLQTLFRQPRIVDFSLRVLNLIPQAWAQLIVRALFLGTRSQTIIDEIQSTQSVDVRHCAEINSLVR